MQASGFSVLCTTYPTEIPLLDVKNYFEDYKKLLLENAPLAKETENHFYAKVLGISSEEVRELTEATSVDKLNCEGEISPIEHKLHESESDFSMKYDLRQFCKKVNHSLKSVKKRMEVVDELYPKYSLKYEQYEWPDYKDHPEVAQNMNPFDFSTVVFCIKIYYPYLSAKDQLYRMKLLQEIHILGDQYLSDLKDKITCSMDYTGIHDVSDSVVCKKDVTELKKREDCTGSFIFIENTCYRDTSDPFNVDISKTVIDWANGKGLGPFKAGSMQNTKMIDLKLRVGHPYVYQHQADCEHIVMVSDIRFHHPDDPLKRCLFPRVYARARCTGKLCMMCGLSYARWFVTDNDRLTHQKNYFCNKCFKSYNYIKGKRVGNFRAFEYVDPIAIL